MSIYLTDEHGKLHKVAGAGYGDIDNVLNKESINPVQNKTLYNPVTFAESERQKSKNLIKIFNATSFTHAGVTFTFDAENQKIIVNGTATATQTVYLANVIADIHLKQGKTYTISRTGSVNIALYKTPNKAEPFLYAYLGERKRTFNIENDATCNSIYVWFNSGVVFDNVEMYLQVEEGSEASDWQFPYGAITHNNDASVVFAESERLKSKNLWADGNVSGTLYKEVNLTNPIPAGTYTISFTVTTSDVDDPSSLINIVGKSGSAIGYFYLERNKRVSQSFTANESIAKILFYAGGGYASSQGDTFSYTDIMITTDGSTDYQPYNGPIAHEKGIERTEVIYDKNTKNIINGVAYTSGLGNGSFNINFSKYKKIICYLFRPMCSQVVDLQQLDIDDTSVYRSRNCADARYVSSESTIYMYSSNITVSSTKDILTLEYKWSTGGGAGGAIGGIYKIEGVY